MTDRELDRRAAHRLAVIRHAQEVTGNVSARRAATTGSPGRPTTSGCGGTRAGGLAALRDGSSTAAHEPERHPGGGRGQDRLPAPDLPLRAAQDRDVPQAVPRPRAQPVGDLADPQPPRHEPAPGVPAVPPPRDRWKRYEKPLPGHRVQIDVKFIAPLPGSRRKYYQYTAIDDCTRIRVLRAYDRLQPDDLDPVPRRGHGEAARSASRRSRPTTERSSSQHFHYHVLDRGIGHVYIRPATPRLNGKVERSHRIDADEFYKLLEGVVVDDTGCFRNGSGSGRTSPSAVEPVTPEPPPRLEGHRAICTHHKRDDGTCRGIEAHPRSLPGLIQHEHEPPACGKSLEPELPGAVRCRGRHRLRGVLQNRSPAGDRLAIDADGSVREGGPVALLARMADHHAGEHTWGRARGQDPGGARAKDHDRHEEQHDLPHDPSTLGAHTRVPGGRRVSTGARFLPPWVGNTADEQAHLCGQGWTDLAPVEDRRSRTRHRALKRASSLRPRSSG